MTAPAVSVIITTYNRTEMVAQAVASVQAQTFKDWELLIIDDGSQDSTPKVLAKLAAEDPRIKFYRKENGGISSARAYGVERVSGQYVAFLDDDDVYLPEKLMKQVAYLERHPETDLVYSYVKVCGNNNKLPDLYPDEIATDFSGLARSCKIQTMSALVRASAFKRLGNFRTDLSSCDDYDMWLRIALNGKIEFLPEVVAEYWWHSQNMSNSSILRAANERRIYRIYLKNPKVSREDKAIIRQEASSRSYLKASDALDERKYFEAACYYFWALSFDPWVGVKIKWNAKAGYFYRLVRPYLGIAYGYAMGFGAFLSFKLNKTSREFENAGH